MDRHSAAWVLWAVSTSEDKYDKQFIQKGNTLLSKASPLKLPQSFCMIARYATPSRRDAQHRESLFPAEQTPVDAAVQLQSALLKLSLHPDVHLFKHAV